MARSGSLESITERKIRNRCTEQSFERGQRYYAQGRVRRRLRTSRGLKATVKGTRSYQVHVRQKRDQLTAFCTCPYANQWEGDCKHIVATFLAWLKQPDSFRSQDDLRTQLNKLTKARLIDRLIEICETYPQVAEALKRGETFDPQEAVDAALSSLDPPHSWDEEGAVAGLELLARRAEGLLDDGDHERARQIYHALIVGCLRIDEEYGSTEIFPVGLVSSYAEGYEEAARSDPKLEERALEIMKEIDRIERFDFLVEQEGVYLEGLKEELEEV
ncbi:MAG: SWIM zinc finger domain-containing protein [Candidatus Bipolaricaulia bacterium]